MLQSLHQGQLLIMQSLQDVVQQRLVMSVEEFLWKVAWLGVQPSPLGGGEASATQEPQPDQEDDSSEATPTPPEPFIFEDDPVIIEGTQQALLHWT